MSKEQTQENKPFENGKWLAVGIAIGVAIGVVTDNVGLWIAVGVAVGVALTAKENKANKGEESG